MPVYTIHTFVDPSIPFDSERPLPTVAIGILGTGISGGSNLSMRAWGVDDARDLVLSVGVLAKHTVLPFSSPWDPKCDMRIVVDWVCDPLPFSRELLCETS